MTFKKPETDGLNLWLRPDLEELGRRIRAGYSELGVAPSDFTTCTVLVGSPERGSSQPGLSVCDFGNLGPLAKLVASKPAIVQAAYVKATSERFDEERAFAAFTAFPGKLLCEPTLFFAEQIQVEGRSTLRFFTATHDGDALGPWEETLEDISPMSVVFLGVLGA